MGLAFASDGRPLPLPTLTTQPFFDAAREGRLSLQHCPRDGFFYYPRSHCPKCLGTDWEWRDTSGRGEVHAFTIDRVGHDPALRDDVPFAVGIIELEEGPRLTARITGCPVDEVRVGMPVEAWFEDIEGTALVRFRPRIAQPA